MRSIRAALVDISGTLYKGSEAVPGAIEALQRLREGGVPVIFISNANTSSCTTVFRELQVMGFEVAQEDIITSLSATRDYVRRQELRPFFMLEQEAIEEFAGIPTEQPNCVVVGRSPSTMNYETMTKALNLLLNVEGAELVATHKARFFTRGSPGEEVKIGPGAFVTGLEYSSGVTASVHGKPSLAFFQSALLQLGLEGATLEDCAMIGDDVRDDIGGAQAVGCFGVLVKTGKFRPGDETNKGVTPDLVADDFTSAVDLILAMNAEAKAA